MAFALSPFGLSPFASLRRRRSRQAYSWFDALGEWLSTTSGRPIYAEEYPQILGLADCARWRVLSQDRAGDIGGLPLLATTTTIEIDSRSLVKKAAYLSDRSIMTAIDRQSGVWRGHRVAGVLHLEVVTDKEEIANLWVYTYTSRYAIHHYL